MPIRKRINRPTTLSDIANMGWSDGRNALHKLYPPAPNLQEKGEKLIEEINVLLEERKFECEPVDALLVSMEALYKEMGERIADLEWELNPDA